MTHDELEQFSELQKRIEELEQNSASAKKVFEMVVAINDLNANQKKIIRWIDEFEPKYNALCDDVTIVNELQVTIGGLVTLSEARGRRIDRLERTVKALEDACGNHIHENDLRLRDDAHNALRDAVSHLAENGNIVGNVVHMTKLLSNARLPQRDEQEAQEDRTFILNDDGYFIFDDSKEAQVLAKVRNNILSEDEIDALIDATGTQEAQDARISDRVLGGDNSNELDADDTEDDRQGCDSVSSTVGVDAIMAQMWHAILKLDCMGYAEDELPRSITDVGDETTEEVWVMLVRNLKPIVTELADERKAKERAEAELEKAKKRISAFEEVGKEAEQRRAHVETENNKLTLLEEKRDAMRRASGNLLAVIHGDGGHYTDENGYEKSCADAENVVTSLRVERDEAVDNLRVKKIEWRSTDGHMKAVISQRDEAIARISAERDAMRECVDVLRRWKKDGSTWSGNPERWEADRGDALAQYDKAKGGIDGS